MNSELRFNVMNRTSLPPSVLATQAPNFVQFTAIFEHFSLVCSRGQYPFHLFTGF